MAKETEKNEVEKTEKMIPESEVQALVRAELKRMMDAQNNVEEESDDSSKQNVNVSRFDGKWVVDFMDRNTDPYIKNKIFEFSKKNEYTGAIEPHITLVFSDGETKDIPFITYLQARTKVNLPVIERIEKKVEKKIGEITVKETRGDNTFDTGRKVAQTVTGTKTIFKVELDGEGVVELPAYVIN